MLAAMVVLANASPGAAQGDGQHTRYPLSPPDLSTPQATLNTFLTEATAAVDAYKAGELDVMRAHADRVFQTFATAYPANDSDFLGAFETALHLLEVLIRIELPTVDRVGDPMSASDEPPALWRVPHTEIYLVPVATQDGAPTGYRFSAATLARLPDFYLRVRELPARADLSRFDGILERFRLRPGFSAPAFVVSYVETLPPVWFQSFGGEPLWKWTTLMIAVAAVLAAFLLLYKLASALGRSRRPGSWLKPLLSPALVIVGILLMFFLRYVAVDIIRLTGAERTVVIGTLSVSTHLALIGLIFLIATRAAAAVIRVREMGVCALDAQLVRLVSKLIAVLLALYVLVSLAETLGVPVAPVLAGLGVGGLAVALAVRPIIENVFAGFVLFADAPVRVGDFCLFGDKKGTVEAIGLRSVQVRGLDRTVIFVPNAEFCQLQLVNFSRRDAILFNTTLQLRYETTPDQLRLIVARLRELLIKHPRVSPDPARVRFVRYGDSSLDIEIFALVETREFSEFLAIQEDLNLRIKDIVESSGSGFAFPSRTLYVEQSNGLDAGLVEAAEAEVGRWRAENRLPFPDHDERMRRELANTLDYPPRGSPNGSNSDPA